MKTALLASLVAISATSQAQPSGAPLPVISGAVLIESTSNSRTYVSAENKRVGKSATLVTVYRAAPDFVSSQLVVVSCDAKWTIGPLTTRLEIGGDRYHVADLEPKPSNGSDQADLNDKNYEWLLKRTKALCAKLKPEPQRVLIPIARSAYDAQGLSTSHALITGTAVRSGDRIEAWVRTSELKKMPTKIGDQEINFAQVTGKYSLNHTVYDCKSRTSVVTQFVDYDVDGKAAKSGYLNDPQPRRVVPGSVGETLLDTACMIY